MSESLQGKVVLVVGASSGIGQATAELAAREGAVVVAVARRKDRLIAMKQRLAAEGIVLHTRKADVTRLEEMQAMVADIEKTIGSIAVAVYASGTNTPQRAMKVMPPAVWHEVLEVNLTGAFHLAHAVLPGMRNAGAGHIVFVSSTAGAIADLSGAAYQASKRGVLGLAHAIRLEERMNGIRTCCIMPGLTNTELVEKRPEKLSADTLNKALQPQDVAETIVHVMKTPAHVTITELLMVPSQA
ncbi:SDR family oxidoreductase [Terriglobus sp. RCC_193]|uniref:SDR family oxidoreductase n=1 Tax=Terriglobus sp. RCC_193 TaxID=3239218 RepID=UPI003524058A